ncbi:hypothetical protein BJ912DRAFT_927137 [Pholiota molesta]|nr:hypothetical protein BJ912DRAFT_927137 [Pholiota molesta]
MNERKSSKWWEMDFQVHVNLRMRREALRDDTPGTKIQETMVLILIYPEAWLSYSGEPYLLAACWQGRNFSAAHTSRSCKDRKELCTYFDEGLPNGQSRVIIEPSDPQNDGEIAEEANQEDDERLIYPSTLEDESDGKSDAEASKMGIHTSTTATNAADPMHISAASSPPPTELCHSFYSPSPRAVSKTTTIKQKYHANTIYKLPANLGKRQRNDLSEDICSDTIFRLPANCIACAHNMTFHMSMDYVALTVRNQCQDCCAHMSMDYVGLSLLGNQWWSELEVSL